MLARFIIGTMLMIALVAGLALYYLQIYAYYDEIAPEEAAEHLTSVVTGEPELLDPLNYRGIDSTSSPVRYRSCFEVGLSLASLTEAYVLTDHAEPLVAPDWFDCFDAVQIGADLETSTALAFMGTENIQYGIDRIVAIYPDGRAYAWQQINACGEVVFDGDPAPEGCPPVPESTN